jgi:hypothetical protein
MADCVAVKVWPAIVRVPLRILVVLFAATEKVTVPLPEPDAPPVTVIHDTPLEAVQGQPEVAVTLTEPLPPAAVKELFEDEIE